MIKHKKILIDQITPVEIYDRIKGLFQDDISFLFESAINNESGSFSYILVGAKERVIHKDNITTFVDINNHKKEVNKNPLKFLQEYYEDIDTQKYRDISIELGIGYVDGFIGYIGYDMSKEFEPRLKSSMLNLKDTLNTPDLDMIRPHLVLAYSHKSSKLTMLSESQKYIDSFDIISKKLLQNTQFNTIKKADIKDEAKYSLSKSEFLIG